MSKSTSAGVLRATQALSARADPEIKPASTDDAVLQVPLTWAPGAQKVLFSVLCWKVENLSSKLPRMRSDGDDDVYALCHFFLGDYESPEKGPEIPQEFQETDIHWKCCIEGDAIFHHRCVFEVPPLHETRCAFPELNVQIRSRFKDKERLKKAEDAWKAAVARDKDEESELPDPSNLPRYDVQSALAEATVPLHDLFACADTNFKLKKFSQKFGADAPLRVQASYSISNPYAPLRD